MAEERIGIRTHLNATVQWTVQRVEKPVAGLRLRQPVGKSCIIRMIDEKSEGFTIGASWAPPPTMSFWAFLVFG